MLMEEMAKRLGGFLPRFIQRLHTGLHVCRRANSCVNFGKRVIPARIPSIFGSKLWEFYEKRGISDAVNSLCESKSNEKRDGRVSIPWNLEKKGIDLDKIQGTLNYGEQGFYIFSCICNVCLHRITKKFSKKAYNQGIVIIKCDKCESQHLVSDKLGWFDENEGNLDAFKILKDKEVSIS